MTSTNRISLNTNVLLLTRDIRIPSTGMHHLMRQRSLIAIKMTSKSTYASEYYLKGKTMEGLGYALLFQSPTAKLHLQMELAILLKTNITLRETANNYRAR